MSPFLKFPRLFFAALLVLASAALASARDHIRIDADWHFHLGDVPDARQMSFNDSGWRTVNLPHDWSIEHSPERSAPSEGGGGFYPAGIGWYRHSFTAPKAWEGRRVEVQFDGVYHHAEVWINGHSLGEHPYGYTPFRFDLTPYLKIGKANVLAVRVDNSDQPNSRWYSGSGIYRHVWLNVVDPIHIADNGVYITTLHAGPASAAMKLRLSVDNDTPADARITLDTRIIGPHGLTVARVETHGDAVHGTDTRADQTLAVPNPKLWSPESPSLYHAVTRVLVDGRERDAVNTSFGIRTIRVTAQGGFELNGKVIKLDGGNVHAANGALGAAAFDRADIRRVELLKAAGFNAVRTAHNPPSTAFLNACDRLGLLVMDEAFDCWEKAKVAHDYHANFDAWSDRDIRTMVRRDRNHPSIVIWSIGNEVYERGTKRGIEITRRLANDIRALDLTRPISMGLNGMAKQQEWPKLDPMFADLDIAGYNYELHRFVADHRRVPDRVIMSTESFPDATDAFDDWATITGNSYVIGAFVWSAMDYLGEAGIGQVFPPDQKAVDHWVGVHFPYHGALCGDIDITGWRKPISHYRNILWNRGELLYAAVVKPTADGRDWNLTQWATVPDYPSWTWPGHEGKALTVDVFSRCDAVRLYLNGKFLGQQPTTRLQQFRTRFSVPYTPGTLKVVGLVNGKPEKVFTLTTAGKAERIGLQPDRRTIAADGQDLSFVTVRILDRDGRRQPSADRPVNFSISGPGVIAGVANADMTDTESYQSNPHRTWRGRALVIVRSTGNPGKITLTAKAAGLQTASTVIEAGDSR